jgi:hypothetical protein
MNKGGNIRGNREERKPKWIDELRGIFTSIG